MANLQLSLRCASATRAGGKLGVFEQEIHLVPRLKHLTSQKEGAAGRATHLLSHLPAPVTAD